MAVEGLLGEHPEGGAAHELPGCAPGLGEDAGEDEGHGDEGLYDEKESGKLGQGYRTAGQLQSNGWVRVATIVSSPGVGGSLRPKSIFKVTVITVYCVECTEDKWAGGHKPMVGIRINWCILSNCVYIWD